MLNFICSSNCHSSVRRTYGERASLGVKLNHTRLIECETEKYAFF